MSSNNENITEQQTNSQNQQENFATEIFRVFQRQARTTITGLLFVIAVLVAVNADSSVYHADFNAEAGRAVDLITGKEHDFGGGSDLPPYSCAFWKTE